jgi:hypothetical protein
MSALPLLGTNALVASQIAMGDFTRRKRSNAPQSDTLGNQEHFAYLGERHSCCQRVRAVAAPIAGGTKAAGTDSVRVIAESLADVAGPKQSASYD